MGQQLTDKAQFKVSTESQVHRIWLFFLSLFHSPKNPYFIPCFYSISLANNLKQRKMKAILIEQNAYEEMNQSIQDVKNELAQMKKT